MNAGRGGRGAPRGGGKFLFSFSLYYVSGFIHPLMLSFLCHCTNL